MWYDNLPGEQSWHRLAPRQRSDREGEPLQIPTGYLQKTHEMGAPAKKSDRLADCVIWLILRKEFNCMAALEKSRLSLFVRL
jgi:hypothetical protein